MKFAIFLFCFSFSAFAVEVQGHLRYHNTGWTVIPVDESAPKAPGTLCKHEDFKDYKDLFVKATVKDKRTGKCFEVKNIEPTVLDPMGGSLKPFRKK